MLANAFKRAAAGSKCRKCGTIVNFAYIKRHDKECTGIVQTSVAQDDDDDDIEVISENITTVIVDTPSSSKTAKNETRPSTPTPSTSKTDEIILLSDSEDEPAKKRSSIEGIQSSTKTSEASKTFTKTARSQVYINDPSAGMTLTEVYEKLMEQLEKLCEAGRNAGTLIASQTIEKLSQSPVKKVVVPEPVISEERATFLQPTNMRILPNSGMGFMGLRSRAAKARAEAKKEEEARKEAEKIKPQLELDVAETKVLQADSKYGSSYIVRFFWMITKRVLSREAGIQGEKAEEFWGDDLRTLYWLVTMSDSEQYLFIRLCLRLRKWLTVEELQKYATAETTIVDIASGLVAAGLIEESDPPTSSITLEEALTKLSRADLNRLARTYKVEHRVKIKAIYFNLLSIASGKCVFGQSMYPLVLSNAKKLLGTCYRVKEYPLELFNSILTLYCPTHMNSGLLFDPHTSSGLASNLLFQLLQVETGKLEFCGPKDIVQCISIYNTAQELREYMEAKRIETTIAWDKRGGKYQQMYNNGMIAVGKIKAMEENEKEKLARLAALPHHLRRYCEVWVLVRCCVHTIDAMERLRKYEDAINLLEYLLGNPTLSPFFSDRRGFLYDRMALDLHSHLKRKEDALDACIRGIMDSIVRDKDRLLLQDRALRISSEFQIILKIEEPKWICITGKIIDKYLGETRINHFYVENDNGEKEIVSVEELALRHFRKEQNFYGGMHSEGAIWHTIFGVICYDIIFDHSVEGVWFSPIQDSPADMNTLDFFEKRKDQFEERLSLLIEESRTKELEKLMKKNFKENRGRTNAQIDWNVFVEFDELMEFMSCIRREQLVMIIKRIIEDHRHHRSGFPDLTLWDPATKRIAVIEVKGPGDKLSTKQRLWLDFFTKHGVDAFVCQVSAIKNRRIQKQSSTKINQSQMEEEEEIEDVNMNNDDEEEAIDSDIDDDNVNFLSVSKSKSVSFTSPRVTRSSTKRKASDASFNNLNTTG